MQTRSSPTRLIQLIGKSANSLSPIRLAKSLNSSQQSIESTSSIENINAEDVKHDDKSSKKRPRILVLDEPLKIKLLELWIKKKAHIGSKKMENQMEVNRMFFNRSQNEFMTDEVYSYASDEPRRLKDKLCTAMRMRDGQNRSGLEGSPGKLQTLVNQINQDVDEESVAKEERKKNTKDSAEAQAKRNDEMLSAEANRGAISSTQNQGYGTVLSTLRIQSQTSTDNTLRHSFPSLQRLCLVFVQVLTTVDPHKLSSINEKPVASSLFNCWILFIAKLKRYNGDSIFKLTDFDLIICVQAELA